MTIKLRKIVLERAKERGDEWGIKILAKMESCIDLVAEEAVYHSSCMGELLLNKENRRPTASRPINSEMVEAFQKLCSLLENSMDCEIYSVIELYEKMPEFHTNVFSIKTFREKLKEQYQENIYFVKGQGPHREIWVTTY